MTSPARHTRRVSGPRHGQWLPLDELERIYGNINVHPNVESLWPIVGIEADYAGKRARYLYRDPGYPDAGESFATFGPALYVWRGEP